MERPIPGIRKLTVAAAMACTAAFVTLSCAALPSQAYADDSMGKALACSTDSQSSTTYYYSVSDAMKAADEGKTIVMLSDWNLSSALKITDSKTNTIDMNGYAIRCTDEDWAICLSENSNLTLTSSATKEFTYSGFTWNSSGGKRTRADMKLTSGGLVNDTDFGSGIGMDANSALTIQNVAIAGNTKGIETKGHCTINMTDGATITRNATSDSGAGIESNGYDTINMTNASICDNYAMYDGGGIAMTSNTHLNMSQNSKIDSNLAQSGGGVYCYKSYNYIVSSDKTASISSNRAIYDSDDEDSDAKNGGGINMSQCSSTSNESYVQGITIANNYSNVNGGGLELDQEWTRVIECTITGNSCAKKGGGIYVDNDDNNITSCTITGNVCAPDAGDDEGGGVYVYWRHDVWLSGVNIIKGNTRGRNGSADDLFLSENWGNSGRAYIKGNVEEGTKVGVRTGVTGTRKIGKDLSKNCYGAFFIDLPGYYVGYEYNDHGDMQQNTGNLVFATSVNGTDTGRYEQGKTITANGISYSGNKVFWYWDAEKTTGLYPVNEVINSNTMYNPFLVYAMPQNDVHVKAVYADRVKKLTVGIDSPLAGDPLSSTVDFRRLEEGNGAQKHMKAGVTWYEVKADGSKVVATGNAKPGTKYVANVTIAQNQEKGFFFDSGISAKNISVVTSSDVDASSVSLDAATGSLSMEIGTFKTRGTAPAEESTGKVTINEVSGGLQALVGDSGKSTQDVDGAQLGTVDFYYSEDSANVTITAPKVDGMNFTYWDGVDDNWISDDVEGTVTIPVSDLKEGLELTAVYTPVVRELEVGLAVPVANEGLSAAVTSLIAKTSDGETVDMMEAFGKESLTAEWSPTGENAAYATTYAAAIVLDDGDGYESVGDVLAQNAKVTFAGGKQATSAGFAVVDGKLCLCVVAPQTSKVAGVAGVKAKKAGKKAAKVTWKKGDRDGVQIRYSLKKSMKSAKKVTVKGASAKAKKIKKLKSGKKYYFQVCAYKTVEGQKCYSSWSKKVSVKVK